MDIANLLSNISLEENTQRQKENIRQIMNICKSFHDTCNIPFPKLNLGENQEYIIIESGHQPNYLPHPGFFKKLFLLNYLSENLQRDGKTVLPIFGFLDYNLSTAPILHKNNIPDNTLTGHRTIGFNLKKHEKWKRFETIDKPTIENLKKQFDEIKKLYEFHAKKSHTQPEQIIERLKQIEEIFIDSHEKTTSFAQLNSAIISKISQVMFGSNIFFYQFSDIQKQNIFCEESQKLAANVDKFNETCNKSIEKRNLQDLGLVHEYFFPFWYHCECGGKVTLSKNKNLVEGQCRICEKTYSLEIGEDARNFKKFYKKMAPTAMARNLIFSQGLGTDIFVSGVGGGLRYGAIANDASDTLCFHKPTTLAFKSMDYNLGVIQISTLKDLSGALNKGLLDLDWTNLNKSIQEKTNELNETLKSSVEKKEVKNISGKLKNLETKTNVTINLFSETHSILDILLNHGLKETSTIWTDNLADVSVDDGEFKVIKKDISYPTTLIESTKIPDIYAQVQGLK